MPNLPIDTILPAAAPALPWRISQVSTNSVGFPPVILAGAQAPHGRPRHGALVDDTIELRRSTTRYPGNDKPTRHTYGVKYDDFVLTGRWMDSELGPDGANTLARSIRTLIKDQLPCQIEWGGILVVTGLLVKLSCKREGAGDIVWTLTIEVDSDDSIPVAQQPVVPASPQYTLGFQVDQNNVPSSSVLSKVLAAINTVLGFANNAVSFAFGFLETFDNYVSIFTGLTGQIANLASQIDSFETAAASELVRMRGIIGQLKTAGLIMQGALDDASNDFTIQLADSNSQASYAQSRADAQINISFMLAVLAVLDDQAAQALAGKTNTTVRAKGGDTWESIALANYGSIENADSIRQANGARGGQQPTPGRLVHIPKSS